MIQDPERYQKIKSLNRLDKLIEKKNKELSFRDGIERKAPGIGWNLLLQIDSLQKRNRALWKRNKRLKKTIKFLLKKIKKIEKI